MFVAPMASVFLRKWGAFVMACAVLWPLQERLNEIYERMAQIGASSAESRASKILHGLGFTVTMQKRSTQSFR